jgi:hypothetical protein
MRGWGRAPIAEGSSYSLVCESLRPRTDREPRLAFELCMPFRWSAKNRRGMYGLNEQLWEPVARSFPRSRVTLKPGPSTGAAAQRPTRTPGLRIASSGLEPWAAGGDLGGSGFLSMRRLPRVQRGRPLLARRRRKIRAQLSQNASLPQHDPERPRVRCAASRAEQQATVHFRGKLEERLRAGDRKAAREPRKKLRTRKGA